MKPVSLLTFLFLTPPATAKDEEQDRKSRVWISLWDSPPFLPRQAERADA